MIEWDFKLIFESTDMDFDILSDKLYEAGCDDGTLCQSDGVLSMTFTRKAKSHQDAINSAIKDTETTGLKVEAISFIP